MSTWRAIGGKCRALMAAAKSSSSSSTASSTIVKSTTAKRTKKPTSASGSSSNANKGILKPVPVSPALSDFLGSPEASRTEAVKKVWDYIKSHNLQNPDNKREIICDEKLKVLFSGKDTVSFLQIASLLSQHFVKNG